MNEQMNEQRHFLNANQTPAMDKHHPTNMQMQHQQPVQQSVQQLIQQVSGPALQPVSCTADDLVKAMLARISGDDPRKALAILMQQLGSAGAGGSGGQLLAGGDALNGGFPGVSGQHTQQNPMPGQTSGASSAQQGQYFLNQDTFNCAPDPRFDVPNNPYNMGVQQPLLQQGAPSVAQQPLLQQCAPSVSSSRGFDRFAVPMNQQNEPAAGHRLVQAGQDWTLTGLGHYG